MDGDGEDLMPFDNDGFRMGAVSVDCSCGDLRSEMPFDLAEFGDSDFGECKVLFDFFDCVFDMFGGESVDEMPFTLLRRAVVELAFEFVVGSAKGSVAESPELLIPFGSFLARSSFAFFARLLI
jgi:hypothetical protein